MGISPLTTSVAGSSAAGPAMDPEIEETIRRWKTAKFLTETPEGLKLSLSEWPIGIRQEDMDTVLWLLNDTRSPLTSLTIDFCPGMSKEYIDAIAGALKDNSHLVSLCLIPGLMERINLEQDPHESQRGEVLAMALTVNTTLTQLCFYGQGIRDSGGLQFAQVLRTNSSLTSLDLGHNGIQPNATSAIAQALIANSSLQTLRMFKNCTGEAYPDVAELVSKNSTLTQLDIADNAIPAQGMASIGQALLTNTTLTGLTCMANDARDDVPQVFADVIRSNPTLMTLNLAFTKINNEGALRIADALPYTTSLTRLCIGENTEVVWQDAYPALARGLYSNSSITYLRTSVGRGSISFQQMDHYSKRNTYNAKKRVESLFELLWVATNGATVLEPSTSQIVEL
ncbi:MAG: hypothetical protein V4492_02755 [Chlamydiota bacterium]